MDNLIIDVALGKKPADCVIVNGKLINVFTKEILETQLAIAGGKIAAIGPLEKGVIGQNTRIIDAKGAYLAPGFIDAHIHFESSMLTYTEFSKMVIARGTTVVASDLMEIAIVCGKPGIEEIFKEAQSLPVKLKYPVPSFMEAESNLQTIGATLHEEYMQELLKRDEAIGLAEVLSGPVLEKEEFIGQILDFARQLGKTAEGHAPALFGSSVDAYASVGIRSDHESTLREEALNKLRRGIRILIREGCAAADLDEVIKIVTEDKVDSRYCSLVSDDIDMLHIKEKGHMDYKAKRAVKAGVDPITALQMITINPAESLKIDREYGSLTPGKCADIVFLSDLEEFKVSTVIANGEVIVKNQEVLFDFKKESYAKCFYNTIKLSKKIEEKDLVISCDLENKQAKVRVIGANAASLLTDALEAILPVREGKICADVNQDVLHIACVERYGKNGKIGHSFIKGFKLKSSAMATSVGHDHHNITAIGANPLDMAVAINRIEELGGGIVIAEHGKVIEELPLPVCGLLSDKDGIEAAEILKQMQEILGERGCTMQSPFMTLAFITLIVIPVYGITNFGLVDALKGELVKPVLGR